MPADSTHGYLLLADFLASLTPEETSELYRSPEAVRFVLRQLLPPLAQQLVLRQVFAGPEPLREAVLRTWAAPSRQRELEAALDVLRRFRVLLPSGQELLSLDRAFQECLSKHLLGSAEAPAPFAGAHAPAAGELQRHALRAWEALLQYVTSGGAAQGASARLVEAATALGLCEQGRLSSAGFRFVLDDRQGQLWTLALAFLRTARGNGQHLGPLRLLLKLGEARIGELLDFAKATFQERLLLALLVDLGVLYQPRQAGAGLYWATAAALAMFRTDVSAALSRSIAGGEENLELPAELYKGAAPARPIAMRREEQGIIVESNFKVYAYTSSPLHICLLGFFCKLLSRLPNLVVGQLAAEPALRAMKQGIRVENIVRYLEAAAHPRALRRAEEGGALIPANVKGQLEVWEANRSRTACARCVLFEWARQELDVSAFQRLKTWAEEHDALLWSRCALEEEQQEAPMALAVKAERAPELRALLQAAAPAPASAPTGFARFRAAPAGAGAISI